MDITQALAVLQQSISDPTAGLPDEVFYFISRITPLVNVDLLIQDENGRTLLSWRTDQASGPGWHVPGGIVRFKERLETRVNKVAVSEIGIVLNFEPAPLAINQCIQPDRDLRSHFISVLYKCFLPGSFVPENPGRGPADPGYLRWHSGGPDNLIPCHEMYRQYF